MAPVSVSPLLRKAASVCKMKLSTKPEKNRLVLRRLKESRTKPTRIVTNLSPNVSGRVVPRRWQQQHRACPRVRDGLDPWVRNGARSRLARLFHLDQIRDA